MVEAFLCYKYEQNYGYIYIKNYRYSFYNMIY